MKLVAQAASGFALFVAGFGRTIVLLVTENKPVSQRHCALMPWNILFAWLAIQICGKLNFHVFHENSCFSPSFSFSH